MLIGIDFSIVENIVKEMEYELKEGNINPKIDFGSKLDKSVYFAGLNNHNKII